MSNAREHRDLRDWDTIRGWAGNVVANLPAAGERVTAE